MRRTTAQAALVPVVCDSAWTGIKPVYADSNLEVSLDEEKIVAPPASAGFDTNVDKFSIVYEIKGYFRCCETHAR